MINNTSRQRWQRAAARSLDTQFMAMISHGMNCSPFEAEAIRDAVHEVYAPLLEAADRLKPGQIPVSVIDAGVAPNVPLAQAQQRLVILTLDAGTPDHAVRRQGGVVALRRHRVARVCEEAFQQGGLLTLEGIADVFNCAVRTLVSDLAALRAQGIAPPLRSTVKDMGRALTHRREIITRWLAGGEYSEIAAATHHSVPAVANYVDKFRRCVLLLRQGTDIETTALVARVSPALVRIFHALAQDLPAVAHRRQALEAGRKGGALPPAERRSR
jgi:hypothetical protein